MTPCVQNPIQDDRECATEKARQLLRQVLPENSWSEFERKGVIQFTGDLGRYLISLDSQTEIRDKVSNRHVAYACLQLSIPAPKCDRMVAEYLLLKNAENVYWKTANIFSCRTQSDLSIATLALIAFDFTFLVNLLLEVWPR